MRRLLSSGSCLKIRSFFRAIENAEGWQGPLTTNEKYFYCLDSLPLFIAIVVRTSPPLHPLVPMLRPEYQVYVPYWPGDFIRSNLPSGNSDEESRATEVHDTPEIKEDVPKNSGGLTDAAIDVTVLSRDGHLSSGQIQEKGPAQ